MALGIWLTGFLPGLPSVTASLLLPLALAIGALVIRSRTVALCLAFMAGAAYADYRGGQLLATLLPAALDHRVLTVQGEIAGLPQARQIGGKPQYRFDLVDVMVVCARPPSANNGCFPPLRKIRLSWRMQQPVDLRPGQVWRFEVKLRRPRGYVNPVGFRYGDWLVQQRYVATGYVRGAAILMADNEAGLRYRVGAQLRGAAAQLNNLRFIQALALADRGDLTRSDWDRFAETGTSHLLAISGLHIGIAAGVGGLLGSLMSRVLALRGVWIGVCTALPALLIAACYSTLAGWALPTQRAFVMVAAATLALCARRQIGVLPGFSLALLAVLLIDPLAGFGAGFYLSFGAVAILLVASRGQRRRDPAQLHPQWAIAIGMVPLLVIAFGSLPSASLPANLVSIPLYSLLIVPLLLAAIVMLWWLPGASERILYAVDQLLSLQQGYLQWLEVIDPVAVSRMPWLLLIGIAVAVACFVLPRAIPGRPAAAAILGAAALLNHTGANRNSDALSLTVLDVGQGLSIVIEQGAATMVYDVGPTYGPEFDTGTAFLLPLLQAQGIRSIDALVVSHNDNDHAGALPRVIAALDPAAVWAGELLSAAVPQTRCRSGQQFTVGRARVDTLYPPAGWAGEGNNASCVMRLKFGETTLLLPGDIEATAERLLVTGNTALQADIVIAPHHGSKTSSSARFIDAVAPRHIIFSAGWRHQFGHPHPDVVSRWCRRGGRVWSTAAAGAIQVKVHADGRIQIDTERSRIQRYWRRLHPFRCV